VRQIEAWALSLSVADRERPRISSDSDNDLAELAILLEIAMGLDHFAEREGSIDDGPECARLESLGDVFNGSLRRVSSPLVSQMLCPLMTSILAIISSAGTVVGASASAP
jgi:hypothetical protein